MELNGEYVENMIAMADSEEMDGLFNLGKRRVGIPAVGALRRFVDGHQIPFSDNGPGKNAASRFLCGKVIAAVFFVVSHKILKLF